MKPYLVMTVAALGLLFTGCATVNKAAVSTANSVAEVRDAFNSLLPPDFNGPIKLSRRDAYFNISIEAKGVHKVNGVWSWTYVHYQRMTSLPILPGAPWKSDVDVELGQP